MNTIKNLLALMTVASAAVSLNALAANGYTVNIQISENDRVVSNRAIPVTEDSPAVIKMDDLDGHDMTLTVTWLPGGWARARSTFTAPGRTSVTAVTFRPGQPATINVDNVKLEFSASQKQ